jgi:iron complex transport system substrate-binding protein
VAKSRVLSWSLLAVLVVALSACGAGRESTAKSSASGQAFPMKLRSAAGTVTVPHRPRRIVSLSATATEDLYADGAGGQIIAVDTYSKYPPQAPRTSLSGFSPNVEAIAKYRPDLVVVAEDTDHIAEQLRKLKVPVLIEPPAVSLNDAYGEITQLGQATGHAAASAVVDRIRREVAAIVASVPRPRKPVRVYHELEPTYYSASSHTFVGQIYTLLGLDNIADRAHAAGAYPQLSAEYILASNPDLIVLADTVCCRQSAATVAARPGWRDIAAVKNGDVVGVEDSIASQWGPRIVLFLKRVAEAVKRVEAQSR